MELARDILAILGGGGVIVFAFSKFLGTVWKNRIKEIDRRETEVNLEANRQRYGVRRIQTDKYAESQYDIYIELWQSLQGLRLAVDSLWRKATKSNIEALARELESTKQKVNGWSIFFEKRHLKDLNKLFSVLENFRVGKIRLVQIRSRDDMEYVFPQEIRYQISNNSEFKQDFENLLEELRESFKNRLSEIEDPEFA